MLHSFSVFAGTPVQNKLDELWSLLNFLMPALFSCSEDFQRWFGVDCQLEEEEVLLVTSRLHQILRPFMLRRLKENVASELLSKVSGSAHKLRCSCCPSRNAHPAQTCKAAMMLLHQTGPAYIWSGIVHCKTGE